MHGVTSCDLLNDARKELNNWRKRAPRQKTHIHMARHVNQTCLCAFDQLRVWLLQCQVALLPGVLKSTLYTDGSYARSCMPYLLKVDLDCLFDALYSPTLTVRLLPTGGTLCVWQNWYGSISMAYCAIQCSNASQVVILHANLCMPA